jgi:hypothetical protein
MFMLTAGTLMAGLLSLSLFPVPNAGAQSLANSSPSWRNMKSPNVTSPNGSFADVSCAGMNACEAVGRTIDIKGKSVPLTEGWDGTTWTIQAVPVPVKAAVTGLEGVSCVAPNDCEAVGFSGTNAQSNPLIEVWDGSTWTIQPTAMPTKATLGASLSQVSCVATNDCEAVGGFPDSFGRSGLWAEEWDGTSWTVQKATTPGSLLSVTGLSCSAATSCEAVGTEMSQIAGDPPNAFAWGWNGTAWSFQLAASEAAGSTLNGVSCVAANDCEAVGFSGSGSSGGIALVEVWDGSAWTEQASLASGAFDDLSSVSCTAASACEAVGWSGSSYQHLVPLAEVWDGSSWTSQPVPAASGNNPLEGVSCTGAGACEAVGSSQDFTAAEAWDGTSWNIQSSPDPTGVFSNTLSGVSCRGVAACEAVGNDQNTLTGDLTDTLGEAWNGTSWGLQSTPDPSVTSVLEGVSCSSKTACEAVGHTADSTNGQMTLAAGWDGSFWTAQLTSTAGDLRAISCVAADLCEAVGTNANGTATLAEQWNGTVWTVETTPNPTATSSVLTAISCSGVDFCEAVGYSATSPNHEPLIEAWNGTAWAIQTSPSLSTTTNYLNGVSCTSPSSCEAVGSGGKSTLAEQWNGTGWSIQSLKTVGALNSVSCPQSNRCEAVGHKGQIGAEFTLAVAWNGSSWSIEPSPTPSRAAFLDLLGVSCISTGPCQAVGSWARASGPNLNLALSFG